MGRYPAKEINQKKSIKLLNFVQTQLRYIGFIKNAGPVGEGVELNSPYSCMKLPRIKERVVGASWQEGSFRGGARHQVGNLS